MRGIAREIGYAFLAWLLPFLAAVGMTSLKTSNTPLFDSLMGVAVTLSTVVLALAYFKRLTAGYVAAGVKIGTLWTLANWLLDGMMFSSGPMKMTFSQYASDIGAAYLAIPVVTIGLGLAAARAAAKRFAV
ncbi:MAG TPA: hypothetical protein VMF30_02465 [Pirellulales bacterium]|nr:hypothetical protein [Pirellulales bacterium]